jgi:hypothetical protein
MIGRETERNAMPEPVFKYSQLERGVTATPECAFNYSQLEAAIASMHNVPAKALKTFKSRLKHFQRIGLVPSSPGKGQKIEYKIVDAITWALCFEFAELGLPPDQIKALIRLCGRKLFESFEGPLQGEDQIFVLRGNFLEWHLNPEGRQGIGGEGETTFGTIPMSQLCDMIFQKKPFPRVLMINLTHLKRELGKALDVDWR